MMSLYEFVVVGRGVVGLSTSMRLASSNHSVLLVGGEESASSNSAGIITLQLETLRDVLLVKDSIRILEGLLGNSDPERAGITGRGFISILDEAEAAETAELLRLAQVEFRELDAREAADIWPHLRFFEDEIVIQTFRDVSVESRRFIEFLAEAAKERGVEIKRDSVEWVELDGDCRLTTKVSGSIRSEALVLCLGAWTKSFLSTLGITVPTAVIRCPAFRFRTEEELPSFADEIYESYWRPGIGGTAVGGGYHAEAVTDQGQFFGEPPRRFRVEAERLLKIRVKGRVDLVESWTGPCSVTPDLEPILDRLPGHENVYYIDGLRGYGLMRGIALGYLLADVASGRVPLEDVEHYRLDRFSGLI